MECLPKTLDEHRDYLYKIVRLQLFFAALWNRKHPEESMPDILKKRVDIFRKLEINPEGLNPIGRYFDMPEWLEIESRLAEIFQYVKGDPESFEEWGFDFLKDQIDKRCERDFRDRSALAPYQCGFLRHNPAPCTWKPVLLDFHIANDCAPRSFFDDSKHVKECFFKLLDIAESMHAEGIGTGSWLNAVPKWIALFPAEWSEHTAVPTKDVQWHYGYWGQFINARGCFNEKLGTILRETGEFPYYPSYAWCTIDSMRHNLETNPFFK